MNVQPFNVALEKDAILQELERVDELLQMLELEAEEAGQAQGG